MQLSRTPAFAKTARSSLPRACLRPVALGFHTTSAAATASRIQVARMSPLSSTANPPPTSKSPFPTASSTSQLSSQPDPRIDEILDFWLSLEPQSWFGVSTPAFPSPASLDDAIKARFQHLMESARSGKLDDAWTRSPRGTLALLILLDQFPRNVYRGSSEAFASDAKAVSIAARAIAKGFDRAFGAATREEGEGEKEKEKDSSLIHRLFFYLPLCHAEDLVTQVAAVALLENLVLVCPAAGPEREFLETCFGFFKRHRDAILRLGRFPARNAALGRENTDEEKALLEENPRGF